MNQNEKLFRSTYRLQLHDKFKFADVTALLPYLNRLGISHLYLSPIIESRAGSNHGYDGLDPDKISTERGGEKEFKRLMREIEKYRARKENLHGVILDIVPNHLAATTKNPAWKEALRDGPTSRHWSTFDFAGHPVILPVLGEPLGSAIKQEKIKLGFSVQENWFVQYFDQTFPVSPKSGRTLTQKYGRPKLKNEMAQLNAKLRTNNGAAFEKLMGEQHYRLEEWRAGSKKRNYRRFFDINELAGVRVEDERVFHWSHRKLQALITAYPAIEGLRVDHVDGLAQPKNYLVRLRELSPAVWVEKILSEDESLPYNWPILGSTGYDFSSIVNHIFVHNDGYEKIHQFYIDKVNGRWKYFEDCVHESKSEMLGVLFDHEFNGLGRDFYLYAKKKKRSVPGTKATILPFTQIEITKAIKELSVALKVYRLYYQDDDDFAGIGQDDRRWLLDAKEEALRRGHVSPQILDWLVRFVSVNSPRDEKKVKLLARWQQLTGPLMAKGFEDTALYRYTPLLSLNGIGGQPDWNYSAVTEFHSFNEERLKTHPLALSTTTTHDTKRNSDVRGRLHVLSEMSEPWIERFKLWRTINAPLRGAVGPSEAFEYFIYQTLCGCWPLNGKPDAGFKKRMHDYFLKAAREEKISTNWLSPAADYEEQMLNFVRLILDQKNVPFLRSMSAIAGLTAHYGAYKTLCEIALLMMAPGVPDTYQGTETWSYSLVDPDNRRPVDYAKLKQFMTRALRADKRGDVNFDAQIFRDWQTGEIKFRVVREMLRLRANFPLIFEKGKYIPLEVRGPQTKGAFGFARVFQGQWIVLVAGRFFADAKKTESLSLPNSFWNDVELRLPLTAPSTWVNPLTKKRFKFKEGLRIENLGRVFGGLPFTVLISNTERTS